MNAIQKIRHLSELGVTINIPKGPEAIWPAIRDRNGKLFSVRDIARATGATITQVETYVLGLIRIGLVAKAGVDVEKEPVFQAASEVPFQPPMIDSRGREDHTFRLTDSVWRLLRFTKTFTFTMLTSQLDRSYSREAVRRYLAELEKAGYILDLGSPQTCGEKEWMLKPAFRNAGPFPPRVMQARFIFDPNRGAVTNRVLDAEAVRL